jgi:hypothetical protein
VHHSPACRIEFGTPIPEATKAVENTQYVLNAEHLLADIRRARAGQAVHQAHLDNDIREQLQHPTLTLMEGWCHDQAEEITQSANRL